MNIVKLITVFVSIVVWIGVSYMVTMFSIVVIEAVVLPKPATEKYSQCLL